MPTIPANKIPLVTPGQLFSQLTGNDSLSIRWLTSDDPVHFEALNRPTADAVVQHLIIARSLDQVALRISHQNLFPFLVQAQVENGSLVTNLPIAWIWDMHVSMPAKWENVRLAKIKRVSGANTPDYTGVLRLVFTGNEEGSTTEVALFQADYALSGSAATLTYQKVRVSIPTASEESNPIAAGEAQTIDGFVTFRTLSTDDTTVTQFFDTVAPPITTTDSDSDGEFDTPAVYEIADEPAGGSGTTNDYTLTGLSHGTGLLVDSATNALSPVDSDILNFISALNYPFGSDVSLQSSSHPGIIIPAGLFTEFNLCAPAGDEPTDDTSGTYYPVWISKIVRADSATEPDTIQIRFSTYNVEDPSTSPVEFAQLSLARAYTNGKIVAITPLVHLFPAQDSDDANWLQGFGRGHVVLSSKWGSTSDEVGSFFDTISAITDDPPEVIFTKANSRLGAWALSRVPQYTPTAGQGAALHGSLGDDTPPSSTNRYVVEGDQGAGTQVDFETHPDLDPSIRVNDDIERYGYTGSLVHRMIKLVVNSDGAQHEYVADILPRLRILLGRDPAMFDFWYDGTVLKFYDGEKWITT